MRDKAREERFPHLAHVESWTHGKCAHQSAGTLERKPPRPTCTAADAQEARGGSFWRGGGELARGYLRAEEVIVAVEAKRCWPLRCGVGYCGGGDPGRKLGSIYRPLPLDLCRSRAAEETGDCEAVDWRGACARRFRRRRA